MDVNRTGPFAEPEYWTLFSLNIAELAGHVLLECPFSALNFSLVLRTSILHPNLKFIVLCQSACIFVRGTGRTILQIIRFSLADIDWRATGVLQSSISCTNYFRNILALALVVERLAATFKAKCYEQWRTPHFSAGWFLADALLTALNVYFLSLNDQTTFVNWLSTLLFLLLAVVEVLVLCWLWAYNHRAYSQHKGAKTLSERYQLAENIRTAKQMAPTMMLHFVNILLSVVYTAVHFYRPFGGQFAYSLVHQLLFLAATYIDFAIELTMIIYHPFLKRNFLLFLRRLKIPLVHNRIGPVGSLQQNATATTVWDMRGMPLVAKQKQEEHFDQLKSAWEGGPAA